MGGKGTFGPGTARNPTGMGELDGVWAVERLSGALPPLYGCVKRIHGSRGTTEFPHVPGVPFEVRGRDLHYPLGLFVDRLEPQNGGYLGRAIVLGRELGQFTMRRLDGMGQLKEELVKHIDEAHAMEQNVLRMLDAMIATTDDPEILDALEHHKVQTQGHADRMAQRLEAHDLSPSAVRQLGGVLGTLAMPTRPSIWRSRATSFCAASPRGRATRRPPRRLWRSSRKSERWQGSSSRTGTSSPSSPSGKKASSSSHVSNGHGLVSDTRPWPLRPS